MEMILHMIKAVVLAVMMFFSLKFLGFSAGGAMVFSMVPLLLGILNVFTGFAYGLTGLIFILACASALVPDWRVKSEELVNWAIQDAQKGTKAGKAVVPKPGGENKEKP